MSPPVDGFDPQPCESDAIPDPLNVTMVGPDPLNVSVTNQITEPLDVNVLTPSTLDVNVTNQLTEPLDVNVLTPLPMPVDVVSPLPMPVDVVSPLPLDVNVVSPGPLAVLVSGATAASQTLTLATSGNGTTVDFASAKAHVVMLVQVNGAVTGGVVDLQASQDGVNWVKVASSGNLATGVNQYVSLSGGAFRWFRGVVSSVVTGGGSVSATLMYA